MQMSTLLDYEVIFEGEPPLPIEEYLMGVNKATLQMITSHFLGIDFRTSELSNWRNFLRMWFRFENSEFANKVGSRCELLEQRIGDITFLSPIAFLLFFEFSQTFQGDPTTVDEVVSERNLFIAYLLFLSATTNKERKSEKYIDGLSGDLKLCALIINGQFPYGEYSNFFIGDVLKAQIIKSCYLFSFLETNGKTGYLLRAFCDYYRLQKWQEFFQYIIPVIQAHAKHAEKGGGWTHINVLLNEDFEKNCFFLSSLSEEVDITSDFRAIRSNPLYRVSDGVFGIIYPLFVVEKIFKGSYFKLKEINEAIPGDDPAITKVSDWTTFYKSYFSESTLLYEILRHIYGKRSYVQLSGDVLKNVDADGPPDYYIRNGKDVYLFENKDVYINGDIRQAFDFEKLEAALKEKLYFSTHLKPDGSIKERPKAVKQLVRNIKKVLTKVNTFDTNYKSDKVRIYPILILHDASFNCPGLNFLVNYWFNIEMENLRTEGIAINRVRTITIINIDTLILYADFLKEKRLTLDVLIDKYIAHGTMRVINKPFTQGQVTEMYGTTLEPFSAFIDILTNVGHGDVRNSLADNVMKMILEP